MTTNPPESGSSQIMETGRLAELGLRAAQLVHELRQPLFAAKSLIDLVRAELSADGGEERSETTGQGSTVASRLALVAEQLALIDSLITRYGAAGARPANRIERVPLAPPVTGAVDMMQAQARRAGISLALEVDDGAAVVLADVVAIQQIVGNLVHNAIDAASTAVVVRILRDGIEVSDDGPDIDQAVLDRLFEPFFTTKPPGQGTGLGLGLTRNLAQAVGGTLRVERHGDSTVATARFRVAAPRGTDDEHR